MLQAWRQAEQICHAWREQGLRVVFTNGCFDLLHPGHVAYLEEAKALGDRLVVGINDDASIVRLKGASRPINRLGDRILMLEALRAVDLIVSFSEDTPLNLIQTLLPDILVKGGDYDLTTIVGAEEVLKSGGCVKTLSFLPGYSSSALIQRIQERA
ncbi:MAG: D-glycero-beta-D-manno-heptose 1-phosphate adenylyltransferase [Zetaproteobacteria bacterium]|nr:D-glycero-beta-D-manno-heptose 1-phosphate adenylyltransferase [Zetaproteobacteria bacterium]